MSSFQYLQGYMPDDLALEIVQQVSQLHGAHDTVVFLWVHGWAGLERNEGTVGVRKNAAVLKNLTSY
jgi:hypothetical protein